MLRLRLLACFAHPDDEAFSASGVLAMSTARGVEVRLVCATRGEAGDIRTAGAATRDTLGQVRYAELRRSCAVLGLQAPVMLGYRDSGWGDDPARQHPLAFVNASCEEVTRRLVREIRRFRPHVVLTFEPGGLSGHKDHIAICNHTTRAFHFAGNPQAYAEFARVGLAPYQPARLFYTARPRGFRMQRALRLRQAGIEVPWPEPALRHQGVPPEDIHLTLDVSAYVQHKLASMCCHRTQVEPDWPLQRLSPEALADLLGREYLMQAHPPVGRAAATVADLFDGLTGDEPQSTSCQNVFWR